MGGFEPFKTIIHEISAIVGEEDVSIQDSVCHAYSFDTSLYSGKAIGVVKPESVDEICEILKIANKHKIPVVPRGFGTGSRGGVVPYNSLVLDMTKFNSFSINSKNLMFEAESGVIFSKLREGLEREKLFLPPEPDFDTCTIGGFVATSKSGRRTLKYGNIKEYIVGLDVVLPSGKFIEFGSKSFKHSGIDVKDLFIGSEGVLGVITKVYCKVLPRPKDFAVVVVEVENLRMGVELAIEILSKTLPAGIEYVDSTCSKAMGMGGEMIAVELDSYSSVENEVNLIEKLSRDYGDVDVRSGERAIKFFNNLKFLNVKLKKYFDGFPVVEDFEVPIAALPFVCEEVEKIVKGNRVDYGLYCHLDSGVIHPILFFEDLNKYEVMLNALCEVVKRYGGYIAGEYGIGIVKSKFLDENVVEVVRGMKKLLDPNNIMNPGKMGL